MDIENDSKPIELEDEISTPCISLKKWAVFIEPLLLLVGIGLLYYVYKNQKEK